MSSLATSTSSKKIKKRTSSSSRKRHSKENCPGQPSSKVVRKSPHFPRIFTEEDELQILEAVLEIEEDKRIPKKAAAVIFDGIQNKISPGISMIQLAEKLRKLRDKYNKGLDEKWSTHQRKLFILCNKIWRTKQNIPNKQKTLMDVDMNEANFEKNMNEENFDKNYPYLMEEVSKLPNTRVSKDILRYVDGSVLQQLDSHWRKQNSEEIRIYLKRVELTRENAKLVLDALTYSSKARDDVDDEQAKDDVDDDQQDVAINDADDEDDVGDGDDVDDEQAVPINDADDEKSDGDGVDDDENEQSEDVDDEEEVESEADE